MATYGVGDGGSEARRASAATDEGSCLQASAGAVGDV
jgi:hypothetical protein